MKLMYRFGKYIMPSLLGMALAGTIAAVFVPYAVEVLLGLAAVCLAGFALCYLSAGKGTGGHSGTCIHAAVPPEEPVKSKRGRKPKAKN